VCASPQPPTTAKQGIARELQQQRAVIVAAHGDGFLRLFSRNTFMISPSGQVPETILRWRIALAGVRDNPLNVGLSLKK
jgi:hypothetical protein